MKRIVLILMVLVTWCLPQRMQAQVAIDEMEVPSALQKVVFNPIRVYPRERFRNKKDEEFYWKTVRDIKKTLPYAKLISATLLETYEYMGTYRNEKEKRAYMVQFEKQIFKQYKPVMKKMTKNQGKMLIKLIYRETNQDSYHIIKAFLGSFRAGFWQTFGKFFGVSLKQGYHPNKNKDDAMIERICTRVEQGTI